MEVKEPETKEKIKTPVIMNTMQKTYSANVLADISPYPTVVIVVTIKYTACMYNLDSSQSLMVAEIHPSLIVLSYSFPITSHTHA